MGIYAIIFGDEGCDLVITIKSEKEIELMRRAGYLVSLTHKYLKLNAKAIDSLYEGAKKQNK